MKLSILIRTIVGREQKFDSLIVSLLAQGNFSIIENGYVDKRLGVEILFEKDNKEISVGAKAQKLIERATGQMVSFIDDDDSAPSYYIEESLKAINENPDLDCIGFRIECSGTPGVTASASNKWNDWGEKIGGFDYVRTIYHKNPVKRSHALAIGYRDMRFSEDYDYSKRLKESGLLVNEVFVDKVMYYYNYKHEDPKTKYGL